MQSQQKRVKWSRGETANALEERTDTGITAASVELMKNCMPDIYGNISRRPALKMISSTDRATEIPAAQAGNSISYSGGDFLIRPKYFVFTIDAYSYIIFISAGTILTGFLIEGNEFVRKVNIEKPSTYYAQNDTKPISTAQYNNFMVVANLFQYDAILRLTETNDIKVEPFIFSAPWYAPNGTQNKEVHSIGSVGINAQGSSIITWTYTDPTGIDVISGKLIYIGGNLQGIAQEIPIGSIVHFPAIGFHMRIDGYIQNIDPFPDIKFDGVLNPNQSIPSTGTYCRVPNASQNYVECIQNGEVIAGYEIFVTKNTYVIARDKSDTDSGWRVIFNPEISSKFTAWMAAVKLTQSCLSTFAYGAPLTPVADTQAIDRFVNVEYGYIRLTEYQPKIFTFSNQRLYASAFYNSALFPKQIPGYAVGSQIAKYNDFKNDNNQANEAVAIDISTSYQEQIVAMVNYNGLKIFTDTAEYAYSDGIVKQSENGTLATCKPIVFGSMCLYADKSKTAIRAMQYEFQTNIFNSTAINQMAQPDLVFETVEMSGFIDKTHCDGRFLFATQYKYTNTNNIDFTKWSPVSEHSLAVCNFVPDNQAMIWNRWTTPNIKLSISNKKCDRQAIVGTIEVNNKVWFVLAGFYKKDIYEYPAYTLAELDYDATLDFECSVKDGYYNLIKKGEITYVTPDGVRYLWFQSGKPTNIFVSEKENPEIGDILTNIDNENIKYTVDVVSSDNNGLGASPVDTTGETRGISLIRLTQPIAIGSNSIASFGFTSSISDPELTVSVYDGDEYKWDDTVDTEGKLSKSVEGLANPKAGFKIDAEVRSHPIDINGKTTSIKKRIAKAKLTVRDTEPGAVTVNNKYGYMSPDKKIVNYYNVTGMKDIVRYTITNNNGAKFSIESLLLDLEYGTLD